MANQTIVLSLSHDVTQLLSENELDLLSGLRNMGLEVQRSNPPTELALSASGTKSVELTILASAAAAPLVAAAVARIIDSISRYRRAVITNFEPPLAHGEKSPNKLPSSAALNSTHSISVSLLGLRVELKDTTGTSK